MGDEYHGCFLHHRSVRVHTVVQLDGSLEVISKHVVDEMIPTYMCHLWILHPIWFKLQDSRASSSQSAGDGHLTSRKRQNYLHQCSSESQKKQKNKIIEDEDVRMPDSHHFFQEKGVQICMDIDGAHFDQAYEFHGISSFMNQSTSLTENLDGIGGSPPNLEPLSDAQEFSGEDVANQFESEDLMLNLGGPIHKCTFCGAQMWFEERLIGSLLPVDGETPKFAQLYIYDTANELANRMRPFSTSSGATKPDEDVVKQLMKMFDETNIIVRAFRMARDRFGDTDYVPVRLRLIGHRSERQYSDAMSDEVAGLIVGDVDNLINNRDIIVDHKSLGLQRISDLHPAFMAMQYPILFPYGEDGFHLDIKYQSTTRKRQTKRGCVTAQEYYAFVIQQRLG
ncbi:hypothetical protein PTKIN_Ptkin16aG0056400 [Pterospermum kingtungense]